MNFVPILMVCHLGISAANCNEQTAINSIKLEPQNSPISCLMEGNSKLASLAFAPKDDKDPFYVKIKCFKK